MKEFPGNPHAGIAERNAPELDVVSYAQVEALLALAYEQRTATLVMIEAYGLDHDSGSSARAEILKRVGK